MVAEDGLLPGLALGAIRRGEVAEFEIAAVAVAQLALAAVNFGDGLGVGQQQVEGEVIAVAHRAHDRPARVVAPVSGRDGSGGVVVGDWLADEAADGLLIEDCAVVAKHVDQRLIAQAVLVLRVYLGAGILIDAGARRAGANGHRAAFYAAGGVKGEAVPELHGPEHMLRVLTALPLSLFMRFSW